MTPSNAMLDLATAAIAADVAGLAEVLKVRVYLVQTAFTEDPALDLSTLTLANFTGSGFKEVTSGTVLVFTDPATGDHILQCGEPAGGWHWQASDAVNLPQTISGFVVTRHNGTTLLGMERLPAPVTLTATGQGLDIPEVRFRLPAGALQ